MFIAIFMMLLSTTMLGACSLLSPASPVSEEPDYNIISESDLIESQQTAGSLVLFPPIPAAEPLLEWVADGKIDASEIKYTAKFGDFELFWNTYYQYLYVGIKAPDNGWVAFGIQPQSESGFKNADIILGTVIDGKPQVYDMYSAGEFGPFQTDSQLGGSNNIFDFNVKSSGGYLIMEFKRALGTGDKYDNNLTFPNTKILWAYGFGNGIPDTTMIKQSKYGFGEIRIPYFAPPEYIC